MAWLARTPRLNSCVVEGQIWQSILELYEFTDWFGLYDLCYVYLELCHSLFPVGKSVPYDECYLTLSIFFIKFETPHTGLLETTSSYGYLQYACVFQTELCVYNYPYQLINISQV